MIQQDEVFKFGGQKLYPSPKAVVAWFNVKGRWFLVKISEVNTQVPLLLSRPTLAALGMNYDIGANTAEFTNLGLKGITLGATESGHPTIPVTCTGGPVPSWPARVDWKVTETWIPARPGVYMVRSVGDSDINRRLDSRIYYPKKLFPGTVTLLTSDDLFCEGFLHWWRDSSISRDFWIETPEYLDRIHVTPRRHLFNPEDWSTPLQSVRQKLLDSLDGTRQSTCIPCLGQGLPWLLEHEHADWGIDNDLGKLIWVGRSRFKRKAHSTLDAEPMGHEEGGDHRGAPQPQGHVPRDVDGAGTPVPSHGVSAGEHQGAAVATALPDGRQGPQGEVQRRGNPVTGEGDQGGHAAAAEGQLRAGAEDPGDFWSLRRVLARGGAGRLLGLGGAGGQGPGGQGGIRVARPHEDGNLVEDGAGKRGRGDPQDQEVPRLGGERLGTTTVEGADSHQATADTDDLHERLNRLLQDEPPAGVSRRPGGGHGLLHGHHAGGRDYHREDQEPGGAVGGSQGSPRGPDGEGEARGPAGEEESVDSRDSRGTARLKKRIYWKKVQQAIRDRKTNRREGTKTLDFVSDSPDYESESATVDVHEKEFDGYKEPRVTLVYGDDYDLPLLRGILEFFLEEFFL